MAFKHQYLSSGWGTVMESQVAEELCECLSGPAVLPLVTFRVRPVWRLNKSMFHNQIFICNPFQFLISEKIRGIAFFLEMHLLSSFRDINLLVPSLDLSQSWFWSTTILCLLPPGPRVASLPPACILLRLLPLQITAGLLGKDNQYPLSLSLLQYLHTE